MRHTATIYFHRYDNPENTTSTNMGRNSILQTRSTNESPSALMAFPETLQDPSWYLDREQATMLLVNLEICL